MAHPREFWHDFFILPENVLAARAVRRLAASVRKSVRISRDQIVLHGVTGCGKTALITAAKRDLGDDMLVVSAKDLARGTDVDHLLTPFLAIEDIQYIPPESAERLVTTLDARDARHKATVITSSKPPSELKELPQRLTSRLAGGLVVPFQPLTEKGREQMARRLAKRMNGGVVPKKARLKRMTRNKVGGVRQLIGELQDIRELGELKLRPAKPRRRKRLPKDVAEPVLVDVCGRVAQAMGTTVAEMRSKVQSRNLATARQMFTKLVYSRHGVNYKQIETFLSRKGMSMSTPLIDMKMLHDPRLKLLYDRLDQESRGA